MYLPTYLPFAFEARWSLRHHTANGDFVPPHENPKEFLLIILALLRVDCVQVNPALPCEHHPGAPYAEQFHCCFRCPNGEGVAHEQVGGLVGLVYMKLLREKYLD